LLRIHVNGGTLQIEAEFKRFSKFLKGHWWLLRRRPEQLQGHGGKSPRRCRVPHIGGTPAA
jgi:hypothetical protein